MAIYLGTDKVSVYTSVNPIMQATLSEVQVTPSNVEQEIYPSMGEYFKKITVLTDNNLRSENIRAGVSIFGVSGSMTEYIAPNLKNETINPSVVLQTLTPPSGYNGFGTITVNPVTSSIDPDIIPSNIKSGVNILGVTGTYSGDSLQLGTLPITSNGTFNASNYNLDGFTSVTVNVPNQGITPEELAAQGYVIPHDNYGPITSNGTNIPVSGFATVSVDVQPPAGWLKPEGKPDTITANGTNINVKNYEFVDVDVPIPEGYIQPTGTETYTQNGTYDITEKASVVINVPERKPEQSKSATPTKSGQTITPDEGYVLKSVVVSPIPSSYIIPSGNKEITENGTDILVSSYATVSVNVDNRKPEITATVTPSDTAQTITPEAGKVFSSVTVNAIPYSLKEKHKFVYSSTEPQNATVGTIWFKPIE